MHVEALTRICPPPHPGRSVNWPAVEQQLRLALPADYKQLVETYGGGVFADSLRLLEPDGADDMYDLVAQTAERAEILDDLWEAGEPKPSELLDGDIRLVPWGLKEDAGHFLYWQARPDQEPEEWTVLLNEGRGPLWEAHPLSCSRFLFEVVAGTSTSTYFCDLDASVTSEGRYRFRPNSQIFSG
ncbi:SMI1/KNR4 family protein [Streptomyces cavernicola]|uniref:Knr4/Smi1-like domain-containing protein n=1 Tax=Streptomyces cavernicola TaxID=3043613 RepID=A0ABT6SHQ0_9ACTN|nr:hypothetical protein [Streptomyces sp. B-S-A6]MDI3407505.1 hypothetical protein [Streptomyces sp. B-S-A6]